METVLCGFLRLVQENISIPLVKKPPDPPSSKDWEVALCWNLPRSFVAFGNSKRLLRQDTKWSPPPNPGCLELTFNGTSRCGLAAGGGIIRTNRGELVVAYPGNLNGCSSNKSEAMALSWGIPIALSIGIMSITIEEDSKNIIDAIKGLNKIN